MICTACGDPEQSGAFCTGCGAQLRDPTRAPDPDVVSKRSARGKGAEVFLQLQASEAAVLAAASRIYAGYIAAGKVADGDEAAMIDTSVRSAMRMAALTERLVQSDDEEW